MKQTKLLFGFAIFLAAGISACSDDTPAPDTGEVAQKRRNTLHACGNLTTI